jgi:hypothetical protein
MYNYIILKNVFMKNLLAGKLFFSELYFTNKVKIRLFQNYS